jgi:hypothetical protein
MEDLDTYSIETDRTVLLSFRNGRQRRVNVERLSNHLRPRDLEIVSRAMKLRHDFIRSHMPRTAVLLLAAGLMTLLALGGRTLAKLFGHSSPAPPGSTMIVRSQAEPQPAAQEAPSSPGATPKLAASGRSYKPAFKLVSKHQPDPEAAAGSPAANVAPQPTPPLPSASPSPSPLPSSTPEPQSAQTAGQTPAGQTGPTPSPTPEQGQVLGDSTGPATP